MNCTVVYGLGSNLRHRKIMPVAEAFRNLPKLRTEWLFVDIYWNRHLIYTTQGVAGYRYICKNCPYRKGV